MTWETPNFPQQSITKRLPRSSMPELTERDFERKSIPHNQNWESIDKQLKMILLNEVWSQAPLFFCNAPYIFSLSFSLFYLPPLLPINISVYNVQCLWGRGHTRTNKTIKIHLSHSILQKELDMKYTSYILREESFLELNCSSPGWYHCAFSPTLLFSKVNHTLDFGLL